MKVNCAYCRKEIERKPCRVKERNYCNAKHQMIYEFETGIRNRFEIIKKARETRMKKAREKFKKQPTMKIGKRGYNEIYIPGMGWKKYHQYIWEHEYGKIPDGFVLHHINFNKLDNRLENLQLLPKREHLKLHDKIRKRNKKGQFKHNLI